MWKSTNKKLGQDELIRGIKINDDKVLKWLYQTQYPKLERYVLRNNGNEDQAKDIFQEAFLSLWKRIREKGFEPTNGTGISGYLFQIGKNKWLDHLRSFHFQHTTNLSSAFDKEESQQENLFEDYSKRVAVEFKLLGKNCKELLTRFYFQNENLEEIASYFNWTAATTRNNKYRCLQKLREKLKEKKSKL